MPGRKDEKSKSPRRGRSSSRSRTTRKPSSRSRSKGRRQPSKSPARQKKGVTKSNISPSVPTSKTPAKQKKSVEQESPKVKDKHEDSVKKTIDMKDFHEYSGIRHSARLAAKLNDGGKTTVEEISMVTGTIRVGKTKEFEMGGWLGATCLMILLPIVLLYLNLMCQKNSCSIKKFPSFPDKLSSYFDPKAALIFLVWVLFQAVLAKLPIGSVVSGQPLRNGQRLKYRCNGFYSLVLSCVAFAGLVYKKKPVTYVYDHFLAMATTATIFSFVLSIILYLRARLVRNSDHNPSGNSGNVLYDFFMGHELNPRICGLDIKFFTALRPGLIGWIMINFSFIAKDCIENKFPSYPLLLVTGFQLLYVSDALWFEDAYLTAMDISHYGFGFLFCFGYCAWVPFLYTLQTRFLLDHSQQLPMWAIAALVFLNVIGYIIYRGSNSQKNEFRKNPYNPALSHLESIPTSTGKRLLVSGWWGLCRHPNYLGHIIMAIAWTLPCGFSSVIPHFYVLHLTLFLVLRSLQDDRICRKKYGAAWTRYREHVRSKVFPGIF